MSELKRSVWGPALWSFLHTAAASLDNPEAFSQILEALPRTLPCPECRTHAEDYLRLHPPTGLTDALSASRYLFEFHNVVNERLGKPKAHPRILHARHGILLPEAMSLTSSRRLRPYRLI